MAVAVDGQDPVGSGFEKVAGDPEQGRDKQTDCLHWIHQAMSKKWLPIGRGAKALFPARTAATCQWRFRP